MLGGSGLGTKEVTTVRDKFWMWCHVEGTFNNRYNLPGTSRMTPAEAAYYFGVPNVIMCAISREGVPCKMVPEISAFDSYLTSFRPLKRVVWWLQGWGGQYRRDVLEATLQLGEKYPNMVGAMMDDFFCLTSRDGRVGALNLKELEYLRERMKMVGGRKLDLWVVLYRGDMVSDVSAYLAKTDVVTFWTWDSGQLESLEEGFAQAQHAAQGRRLLLGCFLWDWNANKPVPLPLMQKQCRVGLEWLRQGRIEGMIFLGSPLVDMGLEAVEWTRKWIQEVGDERL